MIVHDPHHAPTDTLDALLLRVIEESDVARNPYLGALEDGSLAFDDFVETQAQFSFVVEFFPRPMAALCARIPDPALRLEVLRNVWEEHGEGDLSRSHRATFRLFLRRLAGLGDADVDARPLWPEARAFDTLLAGAAALDEHLVGAATLGVIERMFVDISARIGRAVVARGWLAAEELVHYDLHEVLDVRHAEDFMAVLRPAWDRGVPADRYAIEQGLRMGAAAFDGLYRGLFAARGRRMAPRQELRPHGRS